jgi:hypothetical protein
VTGKQAIRANLLIRESGGLLEAAGTEGLSGLLNCHSLWRMAANIAVDAQGKRT